MLDLLATVELVYLEFVEMLVKNASEPPSQTPFIEVLINQEQKISGKAQDGQIATDPRESLEISFRGYCNYSKGHIILAKRVIYYYNLEMTLTR